MAAWRAGFWPWPAVSTWPRMTSSTSGRIDRGALQHLLDDGGAELVRRRRRKRAVESADSGARSRGHDDDDII